MDKKALKIMLLMVGILTGCIFCREAHAQNAYPSASPTMTIVAADGTEEDVTGFDGSAPLRARFCSNVQDLGQYTPLYEWRIMRQADPVGGEETIVRYDADTEYTFTKSGSYTVEVLISFVQGTDTLEYAMDSPFTIAISESKLEVPNAFTPNGDGINDVFKVKEGYQSIVSFEATVFNRWGKRLFRWNDIAEGWDGNDGGNEAPDGAYFLRIQARGADGKVYDIKKTINLLRRYDENPGGATP